MVNSFESGQKTIQNRSSDENFSIFQFLNFRELIFFENCSKQNADLTDHRWKQLRQNERFEFNWKLCDTEKYKNKWNYCLSKILIDFHRPSFSSDRRLIFYMQYENLKNRFPLFEFYFRYEISQTHACLSVTSSEKKMYADAVDEASTQGFGEIAY